MDQFEAVPVVDRADLAAKLEPLLKERRTRYILGAQLGSLINRALPDGQPFRSFFAPGELPRLRTFVERHLPAELVQPTGQRQGSDTLYELNYPADAAEVLTQNGRLWRSFVAVEPSSRLVFDPKTASVTSLHAKIATPEGCTDIAPISLGEHKVMCEVFSRRLAERGQPLPGLVEILGDFGEGSYPAWLRVLRDNRPLDREWGECRHQEILRLFERRLQGLGVHAARIAQLQEELARDHEAARGKQTQVAPSDATAGQTAIGSKDQREKRARDLLHAAADKLTLEQLQEIRLPIGVMLDMISSGPN